MNNIASEIINSYIQHKDILNFMEQVLLRVQHVKHKATRIFYIFEDSSALMCEKNNMRFLPHVFTNIQP